MYFFHRVPPSSCCLTSRRLVAVRFTFCGTDLSTDTVGPKRHQHISTQSQSLLHEDKSVTSHVQIRGSIPVLWSSPTNLRYHPKVRIDPDQDASLRALRYGVGVAATKQVRVLDCVREPVSLQPCAPFFFFFFKSTYFRRCSVYASLVQMAGFFSFVPESYSCGSCGGGLSVG